MSLRISVPDTLADRLRSRAEAEHMSIEELAQQILQNGLGPLPTPENWRALNQRRLHLIEKRFLGALHPDEQQHLRQLQEMADQQLEELDKQMIDDLTQMERAAAKQ